MKNILNLNKLSKIIIAGLGLSISSFIIMSLWNDSDGVVTYEDYLLAIQEPYQNFFDNLQSLPEKPTNEEIYQIYDEFERDISKIKISTNAEKNVRDNYQQLANMPKICKEDYEKSPYKYSTLFGQASNVKMVLDYIENHQSIK